MGLTFTAGEDIKMGDIVEIDRSSGLLLRINQKKKKLPSCWTDNFSEFRAKVEPLLGNLENLAKDSPDIYAHQVLSHGFIEYAGTRGLFDRDSLKEEYLKWARENKLAEELLEAGWQEFLDD